MPLVGIGNLGLRKFSWRSAVDSLSLRMPIKRRQTAYPKLHSYNRKLKQSKKNAADQPKTSAKPPLKTTHEFLTCFGTRENYGVKVQLRITTALLDDVNERS